MRPPEASDGRGRATTVDVAVVGGGPAGAAAAIVLAEAGRSVLVVDDAPRARRRPGESLHPGAEVALRRLGVADEVHRRRWLRHRGHWVEWGGPRRFEAFGTDDTGPWLGYSAPRPELDDVLLDRAAALGADVWQGTSAAAPLVRGGRWHGVLTSRGPVTACWVVDASGRRSWAARHLGAPVERVSPRLVAWWGHVQGPVPEMDDAPALQAGDDGWSWTARTGPRTWAWVRLDLTRTQRPPGAPPHLQSLQPVGAARAVDVTWRAASVTTAPGLLVVGDAAAVLDPSRGGGVLRALVTGAVAGQAVLDVATGRRPEQHVLTAYGHWVRREFGADVARMRELYGVFPGWCARHDAGRSHESARGDVSPRRAAEAGRRPTG